MFLNKNRRPKETVQLIKFIEATKKLDWSEKTDEAFHNLFDSCIDLIRLQIEYYHKARNRMRCLSQIFRGVGLILGTAGFLAPLLDKGVSNFGYPLLVAAAAIFTANSLFGCTSCFTRYAEAQLKLERWMAITIVQWNELVDKNSSNGGNEEKFRFINNSVQDAYSIILSETSDWSAALNEAVKKYEANINKSSKS